MEYAWPSNDQTYSWSTSQVPIDTRCIARSLLIPKADKPDAEVDCFFSDFNHWNTHDPKQHCDTKVT